MYNVQSPHADQFIHHGEILESLSLAKKNHSLEVYQELIQKAERMEGLTHREAALLLHCPEKEIWQQIFALAQRIKKAFYGRRIVLFAPLYLSNYCVNGCVYCPYHHSNQNIRRKKLSQEEIREEAIALMNMGHKRLALEMGEDPINNSLDYLIETIETLYSIKHKNGAIRRVNVNIAATTVEDYKRLHDAGIGTYILFQETYHKENYEALHPTGPKHHYTWHTEAMDRAMEAGIDDVGCGVLYGLNHYDYEFVAQLMHAEHLEARFGVGPHTISVPRICPASDIDAESFTEALSDELFEKIVALLRVCVPYTGIIVSTRESQKSRESVLKVGVSQISGGSRTSVGGYAKKELPEDNSAQFDLSDHRSLDEIVRWLLEQDHIPSFCTACYREGRTGDRFMSFVKNGQIGNICQANALMTLKEYLEDYASPETKVLGEAMIERELKSIQNPLVREKATKYVENIHLGQRDFRF